MKFPGFKIIALLVCLLVAGRIYGQTDGGLIEYNIVGSISASTPLNENPFVVLSKREVQRLLLDVAASPRDETFIDRSLSNSGFSRNDLERLGLIRRSGGRYSVAFSLFTRDDEAKINAVSTIFARSLAGKFFANRPTLETILDRYSATDVDQRELAFVLLGCFSLDWDALALTVEKNYRIAAKTQVGSNRYSVSAMEKGEISLRGIYWGSTTDIVRETAFTTFGDHHSLPRNAFPDLSFRLFERVRGIDAPEAFKPQLVRATGYSIDGISGKVAAVMRFLRPQPATGAEIAASTHLDEHELNNILSMLVGLDYLHQRGTKYSVRIPVLLDSDRAMINDLRASCRKILEQWFAENYARLRSELKDITPLRYGVPFEEIFTHVWHYVFGLANREMVSLGLFADPYEDSRRNKGFIPVIWDTKVAELP